MEEIVSRPKKKKKEAVFGFMQSCVQDGVLLP